MSVSKIKKLSMNPHFYALLLQGFLSGYEKPCEIKLLFWALPILLTGDSRKKLEHANKKSKFGTLFQAGSFPIGEEQISGKARLSGYIDKYNSIKPYCKEAIIILSSEGKIILCDYKIMLSKKIDYNSFDGSVKSWLRSAFYLGVIFSKATEDYLSYFLGVETK